ncbi:MAG: helix-turn-helix transcriptional regulator [Acidimicrobiia bacterium]
MPAVLLLLSEAPAHGYSLVTGLQELGLGRIERAAVYRALSQLEADGLVESWSEAPAGHPRRVYGLTDAGDGILRAWMGVINDERDALERVLRRYRATGTADAVMAEVEGGWADVLHDGAGPVSCTFPSRRRLHVGRAGTYYGLASHPDFEQDGASAEEGPAQPRREEVAVFGPASSQAGAGAASVPVRQRFVVVPERSVILIEARSSVGPISFGAMGLTGTIEVTMADGVIDAASAPSADLEVSVDGLRSGNGIYDGELLRRIDARRYPVARIQMREAVPIGAGGRYRLTGELTFHGVTRPAQGTVTVDSASEDRLVVTGEQDFDIRDFDLASPTVLRLRIFPDVRVHLHVEATPAEVPPAPDDGACYR